MEVCELKIPNHADMIELVGILAVAGYKVSIDYRNTPVTTAMLRENVVVVEDIAPCFNNTK